MTKGGLPGPFEDAAFAMASGEDPRAGQERFRLAHHQGRRNSRRYPAAVRGGPRTTRGRTAGIRARARLQRFERQAGGPGLQEPELAGASCQGDGPGSEDHAGVLAGRWPGVGGQPERIARSVLRHADPGWNRERSDRTRPQPQRHDPGDRAHAGTSAPAGPRSPGPWSSAIRLDRQRKAAEAAADALVKAAKASTLAKAADIAQLAMAEMNALERGSAIPSRRAVDAFFDTPRPRDNLIPVDKVEIGGQYIVYAIRAVRDGDICQGISAGTRPIAHAAGDDCRHRCPEGLCTGVAGEVPDQGRGRSPVNRLRP